MAGIDPATEQIMSPKYNLPSMQKDSDTSDEVVQLTKRHFKIVEKYTDAISEVAESVLLTGSSAWGAYYAITETSDVDLLCVFENVSEMQNAIDKLISFGLVEESERERLRLFSELYSQNLVEQFSLITKYEDVSVSLDFLTFEKVEKVCRLESMGVTTIEDNVGVIDLRTIKEFRINEPKSTGYSVDGLRGKRQALYHPEFREIKDKNGKVAGFLANTLIDGQVTGAGEQEYFLGVMSFFLCIGPVILVDKNKRLDKNIEDLKTKISDILNGNIPAYITRQERMPKDVLDKIKKSFVLTQK